VISEGDLVIVRMPDKFVPWATIRREMNASIRREHGILAKSVHTVEGLAGDPDGDDDGGKMKELCDKAFGGDRTIVKAFALHAWNDAKAMFELARPATK
jgi:hypothetical protein